MSKKYWIEMANLLIGNGVNRLITNNLQWGELLEDLAKDFNGRLIIDGKTNLHVYEEIYTMALRAGKNEDALRNKIIEKLHDTKQNEFHRKILNLPFVDIFTTNYDYGFTPNQQQKNDEKSYSLRRFQYVNDKKIWHIHGELNTPASIMLGYDHYMKSIGKIQGHLKSKKRSIKEPNESWVDRFLKDDLYILGLELDFNEIDLWWLLAYRNRKILEKEITLTKFVYIDILDIDNLEENTKNNIMEPHDAKKSMLQAYDVEVKSYNVGKSETHKNYLEAYDAIINKLEKSFQ